MKHGTFNIKKRIPCSKTMKNRSTNHFPDLILSHVKSSDRLRSLCVVQDLGLPSPPGARGKGLHCEMPQGGMVEINVEDHIKYQVRTLC